MVLRPDQALSPDDEDQREIALCEERIDKALKRSAKDRSSIWISAELFGSNALVRDTLLRRYRDVGWDITFQADQRDGNAYEFKVRR